MKNKLPLIARLLLGLSFLRRRCRALKPCAPPLTFLSHDHFHQWAHGFGLLYALSQATETRLWSYASDRLFVPLALVILAPVVLNIFLVHTFLEPSGLPIALVLGCLDDLLSFFAKPYSQTIRQLFRKH